MDAYELLEAGLTEICGSCTGELIDSFRRLTQYMVEYNKNVNLTRIVDPDDVVRLHYLDSASIFSETEVKEGASLIDVGTGAGFPGLVIKLIRPDIRLCLLDSSNKRIEYLKSASRMLGISGIDFVHGRGEELSHNPKYREMFDFSVSRAVAALPKLCELCLPYVKVGGKFISYKGSDAMAEADAAKKAIKTLGGGNEKVCPVTIMDSDVKHHLVIVDKIKATPKAYPRKNALIQKSPL